MCSKKFSPASVWLSSRPYLLLKDGRVLVQVIFEDRTAQAYNMNLDGTDAREVTQAGEGLAYGLSLSPDGSRIAFHLASPSGYQIWTSDVDGGNRVLVAAHEEYLYFGPNWSPDGEWLVSGGEDGTLRIWDSASGKELRVLKGHSSAVSTVDISRNGKKLVSGGWDHTLRIWNTGNGRNVKTCSPFFRAVFGKKINVT